MWIQGQELSPGNKIYHFLKRVKLLMLTVLVYNVLFLFFIFFLTYLGKKGVKKENLNDHSSMSNETHSHSNVVIIWSHIWGFDKSLYCFVAIHAICMSMKSNKPHNSALEEARAANRESVGEKWNLVIMTLSSFLESLVPGQLMN